MCVRKSNATKVNDIAPPPLAYLPMCATQIEKARTLYECVSVFWDWLQFGYAYKERLLTLPTRCAFIFEVCYGCCCHCCCFHAIYNSFSLALSFLHRTYFTVWNHFNVYDYSSRKHFTWLACLFWQFGNALALDLSSTQFSWANNHFKSKLHSKYYANVY